jgi:beta-lactamase class A
MRPELRSSRPACGLFLGLSLGLVAAWAAAADGGYTDLRDAHDPALQAELDRVLGDFPGFHASVRKQETGLVVADVTDLRRPQVAWYNPDLMLYAASLPKIAIVFGAFVQIQEGALELDDELRGQLVRMIRRSSNQDASAVLRKVGIERLAEILQDERHGRLYDADHGGGLWVGKAYDKSPVWKRDPLRGLSHGASALQAARLYHGFLTGTLVDAKYQPVLGEVFGQPALKHKLVKGLAGRPDVEIYRKSGTWRHYHSDSGIIERDDLTYIIVIIDTLPDGARAIVDGIRVVDDVMLRRAASGAAER